MNYYDRAIQANARQQQLSHEAENWNRAHPENETNDTPLYAPLLARTGDVLIGLGRHLQERYGEAAALPNPAIRATGEHATI